MVRQWAYANKTNGVYRTATLPLTVNTILGVWATIVGVYDDTPENYHVMWNDQESTTSMVKVNVGRNTGASPMILVICR